MPHEGQHVLDEAIDKSVKRPAPGWRGLRDPGLHLGSAGDPKDRLGREPRDAIDEHVDHAVPHGPHLLGLKGERVVKRLGIVHRVSLSVTS